MNPTQLSPDITSIGDTGSLLGAGIDELVAVGDLTASRRWFDAAYRAAERAGDPQGMATAVLGSGGLWVHQDRTTASAALLNSRLRRTLTLIDHDSSVGLQLRIRIAGESDYVAGGHDSTLEVLQEARRKGDTDALALALSLAHHCLLGPDHSAVRRSLAAELIDVGVHSPRRTDLLMGLLWQLVDLYLDADPHAGRRLAELQAMLDHHDHLALRYVVSAIEVMLSIRAGRLAEAETLAHACAQQGIAAGDVDAAGWHGAHLVAVRWFQGRIAELQPMVEQMLHSPTLSAIDNSYAAALAVAAATGGDRRTATAALAGLCRHDLADLPRSSSWLVTMHGVVEAAHLLGDARISASAYELVRPFGDRPMMASLGVACFGSSHHALGVASLTTGDPDRAVQHFEAAIRQNLAMAHWPATIRSRMRLAEALTLRSRADDPATARRALQTAAEEAAALGIALPVMDWPEAPATPATCTRQGQIWQVSWGVHNVRVEHSIGMLHLAVLLANPGADIRAVDLVAGLRAFDAGQATPSAQPALDRAARRAYWQRIAQLDGEIDHLEPRQEPDRAARSRTERDWLISEIAAATGLDRRTGRSSDNEELARVSVGKAIRRALTRIEQADPPLAEHLRSHVHTGFHCSYRPL